MAEGGKSKKMGRNKLKCQAYRNANTAAVNKFRRFMFRIRRMVFRRKMANLQMMRMPLEVLQELRSEDYKLYLRLCSRLTAVEIKRVESETSFSLR